MKRMSVYHETECVFDFVRNPENVATFQDRTKTKQKTLNDFDSSFHFRYFNNAISLTKLNEPINYAFRKWQLKDLTKICCLLKAEPLNTQKIEAGLSL